jgi:hypothetical protein
MYCCNSVDEACLREDTLKETQYPDTKICVMIIKGLTESNIYFGILGRIVAIPSHQVMVAHASLVLQSLICEYFVRLKARLELMAHPATYSPLITATEYRNSDWKLLTVITSGERDATASHF